MKGFCTHYKKKIKEAVYIVIAVLVIALFLFPLIWSLPYSLKDGREVFKMSEVGGSISWFPEKPCWDNFQEVFKVDVNGGRFLNALLSTFVVASCNCFFSILINMLAAYGFARFNFKFKNVIFTYLLFFMFVPGIAIQLTSIKVVSELNMINTIFVLFVPGMANSYSIFFFRQYFLNIPDSVEEAAMLDGASRLKILISIFVPLSVTPMIIIGVGAFLGSWNSYIWPTLVITENEGTLTQVSQILYMLKSVNSHDYGVVIASCIIAMIPPLILFFIFQKKLVEGIASSGLK